MNTRKSTLTPTPGKADILLGLQWGDEGKGKIVDVLTPKYDMVARFQGGPNAGHTLEFDNQKFVLRSIPSGVFRKSGKNYIGNGVVLDPVLFAKEAAELEAGGVDLKFILGISRKLHLIMPTHRLLDAANEARKGAGKIGTTGKGIGPTYTDKVSRTGLRLGDTEQPDFAAIYASRRDNHLDALKRLNFEIPADLEAREQEWMEAVEYLKGFDIVDSEYEINGRLAQGDTLLCEGAQGTMLDVDFGSYPFVTSSNTISAGACTGLGIAPTRIANVYGIFKAYCTRVGAGPFPTELNNEIGAEIRNIGHEYGAVTGRERRCGWLDLVALKYAVTINGVTKLLMMKSDVLDGFDTIKICTAYKIDGKTTDRFPYLADNTEIKPVYEDFKGWKTPMSRINDPADFPKEFKDYIAFIEKYLGVPVALVSLGPDRSQTVML